MENTQVLEVATGLFQTFFNRIYGMVSIFEDEWTNWCHIRSTQIIYYDNHHQKLISLEVQNETLVVTFP